MAGEHLRTNAAEENYKVYVQVMLRVDTLGRMIQSNFLVSQPRVSAQSFTHEDGIKTPLPIN